jgi:hypothetical protein
MKKTFIRYTKGTFEDAIEAFHNMGDVLCRSPRTAALEFCDDCDAKVHGHCRRLEITIEIKAEKKAETNGGRA